MSETYFTPETFAFLGKLANNNSRDWFKAHQQEYEAQVREPALRLIRAMAPHLAKISPHFRADDRKVGGSLFRIQRDTRFSKDPTPYKTHIGIRFRHERAKDVHTPLFYLHLEPGNHFMGAGLWHPEPKMARQIREFIVANPNGWKQATGSPAFRKHFALGGDSLVRPPRGFDPEHPLIEDLKRKDFVASTPLDDAQVLDAALPKTLAGQYRRVAPLVEYLCDAVDLDFC